MSHDSVRCQYVAEICFSHWGYSDSSSSFCILGYQAKMLTKENDVVNELFDSLPT